MQGWIFWQFTWPITSVPKAILNIQGGLGYMCRMGKTLSFFIRLQQAKILLQTTDLNISEIAYAVGFGGPAYFTRTFSLEFRVAPSKFRG